MQVDRGHSAYWQRLRNDKASNISVGFMYVSVIIVSVMYVNVLIGNNYFEVKTNPFYLVTLLPGILWLRSLMWFDRWSVALMKPAMLLLPILCFGAYFYKTKRSLFESHSWMLSFCFLTVLFSILSYVFYRRSLLHREGAFMGQP